ncbi:TRAP transporter small permease [Marinomonas sp.]
MNNNNILNIYDTAIVLVKRLANLISGICMLVLIFSFAWLVYGRYILNDTPTWVEQLSLLLVITISFLTASVGIHERTHLSVDILTQLLPDSGKALVGLFADIIMATFGFLMAVHVTDLAQFAWGKKIPLLGISDGIRYIPVIISGWLICIFSIDRIVRSLYQFTQPQSSRQENK